MVFPATILVKIITYYSPKWILLHFLDHSGMLLSQLLCLFWSLLLKCSFSKYPLTYSFNSFHLFNDAFHDSHIWNYKCTLNCLISSMHLSLCNFQVFCFLFFTVFSLEHKLQRAEILCVFSMTISRT